MPAYAKAKIKLTRHQLFERTALVIVLTALLVFYVVLPQLKYFNGSLSTIQDAYYPLVGLAIVLVATSFFAAASTYWLLANFRLGYWRNLLIQVADGFTNRLLPAGAGGIATNVIYLSRHHSRVQAGLIVGLNNVVGFLGHVALLLSLLILNSATGGKTIAIKLPRGYEIAATAILLAVFIAILLRRRLEKLSPKSSHSLTELIKYILRHPGRLVAAFGSSMVLTGCQAAALYMVMLALNVHLSFLQAFLVMTAGVLVMAATPTPGGVGGAEAGIVAAQLSFGVASEQALSVALLYRLVTYWLPLLPGFIAFRIAVSKHYLKV